MVVQVANQRRRTTGLHVGEGNVQQFFPPEVPVVELELDHLRIVCSLKPEFWEGKPEIEDERLVSWLESKRMTGKLASNPAPLALVPAGEHTFRVLPIGHSEVRTTPYPVGFSG